MPEGGKISLRAKDDRDRVTVSVQDTGSGISPEEQHRIFEPYYRHGGEKVSLGGLGLGLSLSRELVSLHGGEIRVESEEGRGSTFTFSLPVTGRAGKNRKKPAKENGK